VIESDGQETRRLLLGSFEGRFEGVKRLLREPLSASVAAVACVIRRIDAAEPKLPAFAYGWMEEMEAERFSGIPAYVSPAEAHHALRTASWPAWLCLAQLFAGHAIGPMSVMSST
jgi:hypothetical protein